MSLIPRLALPVWIYLDPGALSLRTSNIAVLVDLLILI